MAPYLSLFSVFLVTFLLAYSPAIVARDLPLDRSITFVQEPQENYYIVKKKPAVIVCQARNAADIIFTCDGVRIPPTSVERDDSDTDLDVVSASIKVTRADISHGGSKKDSYWCECSAVDVNDEPVITSRRSYISESFIHDFVQHPESTDAIVGDNVELNCQPPNAEPAPKVLWRKDGRRLKLNSPGSRYILTNENNLVIESVQASDAGEYECVAKNMAGRRASNKAFLTVTVYAEAAEAAETVEEIRPRSPRQSTSERKEGFYILPEEYYFVEEGKNLSLTCGVIGANMVTISCANKRIDSRFSQGADNVGLDDYGRKIFLLEMELPYSEVERLFQVQGARNFSCVCESWVLEELGTKKVWQNTKSDPRLGKVIGAFLNTDFEKEPEPELYAGVTYDVIISCKPPMGQPAPWIHWYKDNTKLELRDEANKYELVQGGSLLIKNLEYRDSGSYYCVAENFVDKRQSSYGTLIVQAEPPTTTPQPEVPKSERYKTLPDENEIPSGPAFYYDFEDQYFLGPDNKATLSCSIFNARRAMIMCNNRRLDESTYLQGQDGLLLAYASVDITADMIKQDSRRGEYFCTCNGWYLVDDKWQQLVGKKSYIRGQQAVLGDVFLVEPIDTVVYYEDSTQLECMPPEGEPQPTVFWEKNGVPINAEANGNLRISEGSLLIEYARVEDEGDYVCVAENSAGQRRSMAARLTVDGKPTTIPEVVDEVATPEDGLYATTDDYGGDYDDEPFWVMEPKSATVEDGSSYKIVCTVVSVINLWFECNGQDIEDTKRTSLTVQDHTTGLTIHNNSLDISSQWLKDWEADGNGEFMCKCKAQYLDKDSNEYKDLSTNSASYSRLYLEEDFIAFPQDTFAEIGESVMLTCDPPRGSPTPAVAWIKDGAYIQYDDRVSMYGTNLRISSVQESDAGEYTCAASNSKITRTAPTVTLTIEDPEILSPDEGYGQGGDSVAEPTPEYDPSAGGVVSAKVTDPYFSKDLMTFAYASNNKPAELSCEARNVNAIRVICNGQEMQVPNTGTNARMLDDSGNEVYVDILQASLSVTKKEIKAAQGLFRCQCVGDFTNAQGERDTIVSQVSLLEVAYMKKEFQLKPPETLSGQEGEPLTIPCQAPMAYPDPTMKWEKDGQPVVNGYVLEGTLYLNSPSVADSGVYTCFAMNEADEKSVSATVTILENLTVPFVFGEGGEDGEVIDEGEEGAEGEKIEEEMEGKKEDDMEKVDEDVDEDDDDSEEKIESTIDGGFENNVTVAEGDMDKGDFDGKGGMEQDLEQCQNQVNECTKLIPGQPSEEACSLVPSFLECIETVEETCRDVLQPKTFESLRMVVKECPTVGGGDDECSGFSDKMVDLDFICSDLPRFLDCKNMQMFEANIVDTPDDIMIADYAATEDWFFDFCERFFSDKSSPFQDCDDKMNLEQCSLDVMASDNSTFWCKTISRSWSCASKARATCGLEELGEDFNQLIMSAHMVPCDAETLKEEPTETPDVEPEGEEDAEEADTQRSSEDPNSASTAIKPLSLLASLLPVLLAFIFSSQR